MDVLLMSLVTIQLNQTVRLKYSNVNEASKILHECSALD